MTVRVLLQGFGAMGRNCLHTVLAREDAEVVAVLDVAPALVGRRVGDVVECSGPAADLVVRHPDDVDLNLLHADVAVHTTTAFLQTAAPQLTRLLGAGVDVVTICQELVFPLLHSQILASDVDATARAAGRSVVAAGVNPGWILDLLPVAATVGIARVDHLAALRVVDFSPYGPDEMAHIGADLDAAAFEDGAQAGLIGHIGLLESAALVATALDLHVDTWTQTKQPIIAQETCTTDFVTVPAGRVRGFRQRVTGSRDGAAVIDMQMLGLLGREDADEALGDRVSITGSADLTMTVTGDDTAAGGIATAAVAVNLIGPVMAAAPGLHTVLDLPLVRSRNRLCLADTAR